MTLIDADVLRSMVKPIVEDDALRACTIETTKKIIYNLINDAPTVDAVPVAWINKHLEWLDNCDNDFAQLAKVSIRAMLELWRKDGMLNEQTN